MSEAVTNDQRFLRPAGPYLNSSVTALYPNAIEPHGDILYRPGLLSKSEEVKISRAEIVRQARAAERASEPIRGGIDRKADMVVGPTLRVHPQPDWEALGIEDKEVRKKIVQQFRRAFLDWAYDASLACDAEGHYDFGMLMWMGYRNLAGPDAECAMHVGYDEDRRAEIGTKWATFVHVIDPDRILTPSDLVNDKLVYQGRRLDKRGRMVGFYVQNSHPSEAIDNSSSGFEYIERQTSWGRPTGIHWFLKTRGGQQRGITNMVTILKPNQMLRKFDESYLASAVINSQMATYIKSRSSAEVVGERLAPAATSVTDGGAWGLFSQKLDYYQKSKFKVGGARIPVLPLDDEIVMTAVNRAIGDPNPFRKGIIREFASAQGVGSGQISSYEDFNYSSARAEALDVWRGVLRERSGYVRHTCTPIYGCVIEEAVASSYVDWDQSWPPFQENRTAWIGCAWTGPAMGWIDPAKEAAAYKTLIDMRITSRTRVAAERGDDIGEILAEFAEEASIAEELDVEIEQAVPGVTTGQSENNDPNAPPPPGDPNAPTDPVQED